jgi:hypothetical protein
MNVNFADPRYGLKSVFRIRGLQPIILSTPHALFSLLKRRRIPACTRGYE